MLPNQVESIKVWAYDFSGEMLAVAHVIVNEGGAVTELGFNDLLNAGGVHHIFFVSDNSLTLRHLKGQRPCGYDKY